MPMFIVVVPEIQAAPFCVEVKVPETLGKLVKSYVPVMVTGTSVGEPADTLGAEPIVNKAMMHNAIPTDSILFCRITTILLFIF